MSDRDRRAALCAELVLSGEWDQASAAAKGYRALSTKLDELLIGKPAGEIRFPDQGPAPAVD